MENSYGDSVVIYITERKTHRSLADGIKRHQ
jgi:hypothetical protein